MAVVAGAGDVADVGGLKAATSATLPDCIQALDAQKSVLTIFTSASFHARANRPCACAASVVRF